MTYPIEGSCQCGGVKYRLLEPPLRVVACLCKECQKQAWFTIPEGATVFEKQM